MKEPDQWGKDDLIGEEEEKFENHFSNFERRKRKLNSLSPVSRREREISQSNTNF